MSFEERISKPGYKTWLKAGLCLQYVKDGLLPFVVREGKSLHCDVLLKVRQSILGAGVSGPISQCTTCAANNVTWNQRRGRWDFQYTDPISGNTVNYCPNFICHYFKDAITAEHTSTHPKKMCWSNCDFKTWPNSYWNVAKALIDTIEGGAIKADPDDCDCNALLKFIEYSERCQNAAKISIPYVKQVQQHRNEIMHSKDMTLDDDHLRRYTDGMISLLESLGDYNTCEAAKSAVDNIKLARDAEILVTADDENRILKSKWEQIVEIKDSIDELKQVLQTAIPWQYLTRLCGCMLSKVSVASKKRLAAFLGILFFSTVALPYMYLYFLHQNEEKVCVSDEYTFPWENDATQTGFIGKDSDFVGRKWLINNITSTLTENRFQQHGLHLVADKGYGKSAIVNRLLCVSDGELGYTIRKQILAYHICKFNSPLTTNPAIFIRRLIGMIAKIPQLKSEVAADPSFFRMTLGNCENDPIHCLHTYLYPLLDHEVTLVNEFLPKLIVVDALDECNEHKINGVSILDILQKIIDENKIPTWIKFIVTSRNIGGVAPVRMFSELQLRNEDEESKDDLRRYILNKVDNETIQQYLIRSVDNPTINFLYVKHAIQFRKAAPETFPVTFSGIIEANFKRVYGQNGEEFDTARTMFAIIVASRHYDNNKDTVLGAMQTIHRNLTKPEFDKLLWRSAHFLSYSILEHRVPQGYNLFVPSFEIIDFSHKVVYEWLTNDGSVNPLFKIYIEIGYKALAEYCVMSMSRYEKKVTIREINTASHFIRKTGDITLRNKFLQLPCTYNLLFSQIDFYEGLIFGEERDLFLQFLGICSEDKFKESFSEFNPNRKHMLWLLETFVTSPDELNIRLIGNCSTPCRTISEKNSDLEELAKDVQDVIITIKTVTFITVHLFCLGAPVYPYEPGRDYVSKCLEFVLENKHLVDMTAEFIVTTLLDLNPRDTCYYMTQVPYLANLHGRLRIAKLLVTRSFGCIDVNGYNVMVDAVERNQTELAVFSYTFIKAQKLNVTLYTRLNWDTLHERHGQYVQHVMILRNYTFMLKQLSLEGMDWTVRDYSGLTPVHYAAALNRNEMLEYITDESNVYARAEDGRTPVHLAAMYGSLGSMLFFHRRFNTTELFSEYDDNGRSTLHYVTMWQNVPALVPFALENYLSPLLPEYKSNDKKLKEVILRDFLKGKDIIKHYLSTSAAITDLILKTTMKTFMAVDKSGNNILHYALEGRDQFFIQYILRNYPHESRLLLLQRNKDGFTPLSLALKESEDVFNVGHIISVLPYIDALFLRSRILDDVCHIFHANNSFLKAGWIYFLGNVCFYYNANTTTYEIGSHNANVFKFMLKFKFPKELRKCFKTYKDMSVLITAVQSHSKIVTDLRQLYHKIVTPSMDLNTIYYMHFHIYHKIVYFTFKNSVQHNFCFRVAHESCLQLSVIRWTNTNWCITVQKTACNLMFNDFLSNQKFAFDPGYKFDEYTLNIAFSYHILGIRV